MLNPENLNQYEKVDAQPRSSEVLNLAIVNNREKTCFSTGTSGRSQLPNISSTPGVELFSHQIICPHVEIILDGRFSNICLAFRATPCKQYSTERSAQLFRRNYISGFVLLLQAALSLLGNSGVHAVLGCQHEHSAAGCCSTRKSDAKHHHKGCCHSHSHRHDHPQRDEHKPAHGPLTDDDCAICQAFTRPAEVAVAIYWTEIEGECTDFVADPVASCIVWYFTEYEVRGPPVAA